MKRDGWFYPAEIMYCVGKVIAYAALFAVGYGAGCFLNGVIRACIDFHLLWF